MREGHVDGIRHAGKSLQGRQTSSSCGSCLQGLHLLASHTASSCCEWVGSQGRRREESRPAPASQGRRLSLYLQPSWWQQGSHGPILPVTLGALGKAEMGSQLQSLELSSQPRVTTLCTWSRPGHTLTAWPKSPNWSWFKFSFLSQILQEPSMSVIRWSSVSLKVRSVSYDVTVGYSGGRSCFGCQILYVYNSSADRQKTEKKP